MKETVRLSLDVLDALPGDAMACVVEALLEATEGTVGQKHLADRIGVNEGTVRRAIKRLVDSDLIDPPKNGRKARADARVSEANNGRKARADARVSSRAGAINPSSSNELFPSGMPAKAGSDPNPAVAVARKVWQAKEPRPVIKFGHLIKLCERFLDAGWDEDEVEAAMIAAPTISIGWVESALMKKRRSTRTVATDRSEPSGEVEL